LFLFRILPGSSDAMARTEMIEDLLKASTLIADCSVTFGSDGRNLALIVVNEAEAANMCREQIDGLLEQAVLQANRRLPPDEHLVGWKVVERC
jgi:hypothetical protein